jgi:glycosyltransferase involved in cell wall biosynthesis
MKILIVSDAWHPQVNGVVRTYERLSEALCRRGHDIKVIGPGEFPLLLPLPGYAEIKLSLFAYRRLTRMIESFKPDHIHIATEGPLGWAARRYAVRNKHDFSTAFHTQFPDYVAGRYARQGGWFFDCVHGIVRAYVRRFHAPASKIIVSTDSLAEQLKSWGFAAPAAIVTRGADLSLFNPGDKKLFQDLKRPVALYVGRLAIEKSVDDFLDMKWPGSKVVVGDGPRFSMYVQKYPDVVFAGRRFGEDLAAHYRSADVFVFPSRTDTFGIVLIEALASGIPVAAYDVMGPRDIITAPYLGVLTNDDLADAARLALDCGDSSSRAVFVKDYYTWDNAALQFEEALKI